MPTKSGWDSRAQDTLVCCKTTEQRTEAPEQPQNNHGGGEKGLGRDGSHAKTKPRKSLRPKQQTPITTHLFLVSNAERRPPGHGRTALGGGGFEDDTRRTGLARKTVVRRIPGYLLGVRRAGTVALPCCCELAGRPSAAARLQQMVQERPL